MLSILPATGGIPNEKLELTALCTLGAGSIGALLPRPPTSFPQLLMRSSNTPSGTMIANDSGLGFPDPVLRHSAVGTTHFEPGGVSFRLEGRRPMAKQKVPDLRW
jgi:hypothetical protein